ncbi:MAG: glycosyltransferase [Paludibacter sp.]|nr:glycosyltransferase [Paludibacter sp.]
MIKKIKIENPDIIHLHNLHGNYLHLETLFSYLNSFKGKVFLTLHDCWAFTGKCAHYTDANCYKWQQKCEHCPQVHTYPPSVFFDFSKKMFKDKKTNFCGIENLKIITVSDWLKKQVENSFLNIYEIERVYNWVDNKVFKNTVGELRHELNIHDQQKIILCVSASWRKTDSTYKDLIQLSEILGDENVIIVVGKAHVKFESPNIINIPYIADKNKMAELYSSADVYLHLSTEDTFGLVIAEALSCGTPAIVYNSTACAEVLGSDNCGRVVEVRNIDQIVNAIDSVFLNGKEVYRPNCEKRVKTLFDKDENISKIIELYKS